VARFTVTIRRRGKTERERHETLGGALVALEARLDELGRSERRDTERALRRTLEPVQQVAVRGEIAGPRGLRGGVDVRGDGSAEAYTGRWRRVLVERRKGESAYEALARVLSDSWPE
jgi:hypothetical protein